MAETRLEREIEQKLKEHLGQCEEQYGSGVSSAVERVFNETLNSWFCPPVWDTILCWPPTLPNTMAVASCPDYIVGFHTQKNATRFCTEDGTWFYNEHAQRYWSNYSQCFDADETTIEVGLDMDFSKINSSLTKHYVPFIKAIPRVGYTVSLCTLLVAFTIMFSIKKLHCPRNNLHMNLFVSFIFRAFTSIFKDFIFVDGVGLSSNIKYKDGETFYHVNKESNDWLCKLITSSWEFFITANYSWILMEGLYLHNLIFRALFTDSGSSITPYVILGWGLPILVIIPWIITRLMIEDTFCWTTHDDSKHTVLIIQIPTTISMLINAVLFIRIAMVLLNKLNTSHGEEIRRYQRWAKSTLVLVPLFGIHYAIFIVMWMYPVDNQIVTLTWLIFDQLFASFQGFFVAILYCFLNGEVRAELKPRLQALCSCLGRGMCCGGDDFRTIKSRSSVCTMLSSTSLYNGVNCRHKSRWDCLHSKHPFLDKSKEHICRPGVRSWHDISPRRTSKLMGPQYSPFSSVRYQEPTYDNGSLPQVNACPDCQEQERCRSEPQLGIELMNMLSQEQ